MTFSDRGATAAMGIKAHVLYSRLLKGEDYYALLKCNSIAEIAAYLRSSESYGAAMQTIHAEHVHRIDLESAVRKSIMAHAESMLFYMNGERRTIFRNWLDWYDSENLKSLFRWIRSRRLSSEEMRQRLFPVPGSKIPYDMLLASRNFAEAHEALRDTKYYLPMEAAIGRLAENEQSLFSLELAIDNITESSVYKALLELSDPERTLLRSFFGTQIDLQNIYILVRCLLYYGMSLEETLSRLLPVKYKIKMRHLREIARGTTWEERLARLGEFSPLYAKIFGVGLETPDFELAMEISMKRFNYLKALKIFHTGPPGFHTAMAYCLLKAFELDDVIKMIEDVRYDYDRRSAAQYLIRPVLAEEGVAAWR